MTAKNLTLYVVAVLILLSTITLLKGWLNLFVIPLWVGGLIGIFLPEVDHLIYAYFLRPHEYESQRMQRMVKQGQVVQSMQLGLETRPEKQSLVFHTISFQVIFTLFSLFVVSSTGSLLGRGIVYGFLLNLVIDQYFDLRKTEALENWFQQVRLSLTRQQAHLYVFSNLLVIIIFAFLF